MVRIPRQNLMLLPKRMTRSSNRPHPELILTTRFLKSEAMDHSNIIFDFELDFLEQYQTETLLQILKDKYGKGTRIKATEDRSFDYVCPCPVHEDGRNPNGRVTFSQDGTLRLYCNGACSLK